MSAIGHALVRLHLVSMGINLYGCFVVAVEAVLDPEREIFACPQWATERGNWLVIADAADLIIPDSFSEGDLLFQELHDQRRI